MESRWSDDEAERAVARYAALGVGEVWRCAPTRRACSAPTGASCCMAAATPRSRPTCATCIGDHGRGAVRQGLPAGTSPTIEPAGHPAVRLAPLLRLRALDALSDEDMVSVQRANLLDSAAPNPSVETLLHAFMPHKFVDHTHSVAAIAIADQPDAEEISRRIYGERVACVPYVLPGFGLAKAAAEAFEARPRCEGLTARQARHLLLRRHERAQSL